MIRSHKTHEIRFVDLAWLSSSNTKRLIALGSVAIIMAIGGISSAQPLMEERTPTGGSRVEKRTCSNNSAVLCRTDSCGAGGTCDDTNIFNLTVNLRTSNDPPWDPTQAEKEALEANFNAINEAIFDASDGQIRLGRITLVRKNQASDAVVQLFAGTCTEDSEQNCTQDSDCTGAGLCSIGGASAPPGGWGIDGKIVVGLACLRDPLCFTHQFMHLIGNVHDENEGSLDDGVDNDADGTIDECDENPVSLSCVGGSRDGEPCDGTTACVDNGGTCQQILCTPLDVSGCLMQFPLESTGSELCVADNHDDAVVGIGTDDTEQSRCHGGRSCWEQLGIEWPSVILPPAGLPDEGPSNPPEVPIVEPGIAKRVVVVIDRSGSMDSPDEDPSRMQRAVNAVQDFIDLLSNGTEFSLVSFADDSTKDFPAAGEGLRIMDDADDRTDAQTATGGLIFRTAGLTNIGAGLRQAHQTFLENEGEITLRSSIILLTDGLNNMPDPDPKAHLNAVINELQEAELGVNVTCIGSARDSTQCAEIATGTGGYFVDSPTEANLYDAFVDFVAKVEGSGIAMTQLNTPIDEGEAVDIDVVIESGAQQARFVVSWTRPTNNLDLQLLRPDGTSIPVGLRQLGTQGEFYRIDTPEAGTWKMRVEGTTVAGTELFSARVLVDNQELNFDSNIARSVISWPEGFFISAHPSLGRGIAGCDVRATVQKPDGTLEEVELQDEGATGDGDAQDGLYSVLYRNFTGGDGLYTFLVRVRCEQGAAQTIYPYQAGIEDFPFTPVVPTFERTLRFSGLVTGVPANLPPVAAICRDMRIECQGPMAPVTLDGTCSFDPEGDALNYRWFSSTGAFADNSVAMPTAFFPLGRNHVKLEVEDPYGEISPFDFGLVVVADTSVPVIHNLTATPETLWSPNHGMVPVTLTVDVTEACDSVAICEITSVTSNEPDNGEGDGNTEPDWEITGALSLNLRSERAGGGDGRVYTVEVTCGDSAGYESRATATISVPHDQGGEVSAIELQLDRARGQR